MNHKCFWKACVGILIFPAVLGKQEWFKNIEHCLLHVFYWSNKLTNHAIQVYAAQIPKLWELLCIVVGALITVVTVYWCLLMSIVFGHLFYDIRGMAFSFFLLKFQDTRLWLPLAWPDHARLAHVKSQKSRSTQHHILVLNRQNVSTMWPQWSSIGFSENHGIPLSQWLGLTG